MTINDLGVSLLLLATKQFCPQFCSVNSFFLVHILKYDNIQGLWWPTYFYERDFLKFFLGLVVCCKGVDSILLKGILNTWPLMEQVLLKHVTSCLLDFVCHCSTPQCVLVAVKSAVVNFSLQQFESRCRSLCNVRPQRICTGISS